MRILLKILLFPVTLTLSLVLAVCKFALFVGGGILGVVSMLFALIGVGGLITGDFQTVALPSLIFAFLVSPFGIPMLAAFFVACVEGVRDWMRGV